jgi:hypothetical protein
MPLLSPVSCEVMATVLRTKAGDVTITFAGVQTYPCSYRFPAYRAPVEIHDGSALKALTGTMTFSVTPGTGASLFEVAKRASRKFYGARADGRRRPRRLAKKIEQRHGFAGHPATDDQEQCRHVCALTKALLDR